LAQVLAQLYMNSKNLRRRKIEIHPGWFFHFATKYFNNMVFLFIYMQKKRFFSNINLVPRVFALGETRGFCVKWRIVY
jgi:hypothetical protein